MKLPAIKVNSALAEQGRRVDSSIPDLPGIRIKAAAPTIRTTACSRPS